MNRRLVFWVVLVWLGSACVAHAVPFTNPPEDSGEPWFHPYPYHRNALIDFASDPATWDAHWDNTAAWALDPASGYQLFGSDDYGIADGREMWEYDWLSVQVTGGTVSWLEEDTITYSGREGMLLIMGNTPGATMTFEMEWNMANRPGYEASHLWSEMFFFVNAEPEAGGELLVPDGHSADGYFGFVPFEGGPWNIMNAYVATTPSPAWQSLWLEVSLTPPPDQPGIFMMDSWHTATEVPEPGTMALLGLGAVGLALWRRRRRGS